MSLAACDIHVLSDLDIKINALIRCEIKKISIEHRNIIPISCHARKSMFERESLFLPWFNSEYQT